MNSTDLSEEYQASLDMFKEILSSGLSQASQPPLLPTLMIETEDEIRIAVLDPSPEPEETFEVVLQWKQAVLEDEEDTRVHGVGFMAGADEIALGVFPPAAGTWLAGRFDATTGIVEWSPRPMPGSD